jgi:hypothetical protein
MKNMNENIEQAIYELRTNSPRYQKTESYYRGEHQLAFASEKFRNTFGSLFREFAMNLCPAVCDSVRDKLIVTGFTVDEDGVDREPPRPPENGGHLAPRVRRGAEEVAAAARRIWQANRMAVRASELHKEVLKNGDAFAFVWPGPDGRPTIYPNRASSCTVVYDEESPGKILWAAKFWLTSDKRARLNLLYPDRIEKYISAREVSGSFPDAKEFVPLIDTGTRRQRDTGEMRQGLEQIAASPSHPLSSSSSVVRNPYGVVPVFHFANNADIGSFGQSELEAALPIQDGMNKSVLDMLVSMEFAAYRQRWAAGIEIEYDADGKPVAPFTAGVEHLWISQNPEARFGDFENSNLEQFLKVKDSFRIDIASVTGTPLHYLMPFTPGFHSGEAFRKAETRFISKVRSRQESFGQVWAALMSFALRIAGFPEGVRLQTNWEDPSQLSETEILENIRLKKALGLPTTNALREAGYGSDDSEQMAAGK